MAMIKTCSTPPIAFPEVSGPVCSFKALQALPLKKCEVAINAWQEGTGDPSPSNVRPIHGFSEVNATRAGKNLFDKTKYQTRKYIDETTGAIINISNDSAGISDYIPVKAGEVLYIPLKGTARNSLFDKDKNLIRYFPKQNGYVTIPTDGYIVCGGYNLNIDTFQLEVGSTATAYEPYVTPTIYTIQLGQEVYGAEVDVVNGVMSVTHEIRTLSSKANIDLVEGTYNYFRYIGNTFNSINQSNWRDAICNQLDYASIAANNDNIGFSFALYGGKPSLRFRLGLPSVTTLDELNEYLTNNPLSIVFPREIPTQVQLTPTQIETLIGNNTIFADTGYTTVQYIKIGG